MFPYLFVLVTCFLLFGILNTKVLGLLNCKPIVYLYLFFLGLFLCFGYTTGSDWRTYEKLYEWVENQKDSLFLFVEPGYVIYNSIFKLLGIPFFPFFIFTKVVLYLIVIKSLKYYCLPNTFFLSLLFFISWYAFFLFIDNPMRNLIAVGIFLMSLRYVHERNFKKYLMMTILAVSFHFSAIIMLLFYYLANKRISTSIFVLLFIVLNVILLSRNLIFGITDALFSNIPLIGDKILAYSEGGHTDGEGKLFSFGLLVHVLIFSLLMYGRKTIEKYPSGEMIFVFAAFFPIFFRLGLTITVMGRFQLYIAVFYVAAIGMLYHAFNRQSKYIYLIFILTVSMGSAFTYLRSPKYVPYTHYWFMNEMPYEERSEYNLEHSPYKDNQ